MSTERERASTAADSAPETARGLLLEQTFDRAGLVSLRNAVAAHGATLGLPRETVEHLVLAAYELASNAVRHGGGRGRLWLSADDGVLRCVVRDDGPGLIDPTQAGRVRPEPTASGGRGLWLVRCVASRLDLRTGEGGLTAIAEFPLS
ncbi:hypothetical protein GCM10023322_60220 [Rugosimonospora acidiphila]|uniref:Histidine kinase/HSP90-like ATPase domain-containing protein n=1 Tax=Rugosimonospora acidiphila TaxID=556531 RepID=A0ABP9SGJ1_9ACTN